MIEQHTNGALVTDAEGDLLLAVAKVLTVLYPKRPQAPGPERDAIYALHAALGRFVPPPPK